MLSWKVALFQKKEWDMCCRMQRPLRNLENLHFFEKTQQYSSLLVRKRYWNYFNIVVQM